jgi:hypothetical protein
MTCFTPERINPGDRPREGLAKGVPGEVNNPVPFPLQAVPANLPCGCPTGIDRGPENLRVMTYMLTWTGRGRLALSPFLT